MKKKFILVTGGAGFIGSNLIEALLQKTSFKILSLDNYSSGTKKNHIKSNRVKYIFGQTKNIHNLLKKFRNSIHTIFHFGEFSRIYQSFKKFDECFESNTLGSNAVFKFCFLNKIKLIYSATSASLGNRGFDKNLSPYAFFKSKNLEYLENLKNWFNFKFEVVYFYNVYGPRQICTGDMATVIGIFENQFLKNKHLTVVKPGSQTRRFTHINDTIKVCLESWKKNKCQHYSITNKHQYSILKVAKIFGRKIKFLPCREGERYASKITNMNLSNKINRRYGRINLKNYITNFIKDSFTKTK